MGYKRKKTKLTGKLSTQSDDMNESLDQLELKVGKIEDHFKEEEPSDVDNNKDSKRIKLEKGDIGDDPVMEDSKQIFDNSRVNIKPEAMKDEMDYSPLSQDLLLIKESILADIKKEDVKPEEYYEELDVKPDWVEDETIPKGWKRRIIPGIGVSKYNMPNLVSPDGRQFRSRQRACQTMFKRGADLEEMKEMSDLLIHEGWESHPMLPEGWKFRKYVNSQKTSVQFMNNKFQNFKSITAALDELSRDYDEEAANGVTMLLEILNVERRMESYDWKQDSSLPAGWKSRIAEGKKGKVFYLSPDGRMFPSRSIGLQQMIKDNYTEDEIKVMKTKLVEHEGWEINENLPKGWIFKTTYNGKNIQMLTSEGDVVESFVSAVEYMKSNDKYSPMDIDKIQQMMSEKGIERRLESYKWEENHTIPQGWKMRTAESKTEKQYFLAPEGISFPSRFVSYQHMIKENHSPSEIANMRMCLKYENWQESPLLPRGWGFKETDGNHGLSFLSSKGTLFKSFVRALQYAENCDREEIGEDDLERMKLFQEDVSIDRRIMGYSWQESKSLPVGWKIRTAKGKVEKEFLLSPSGIQYPCRRMALVFLIQNKFPEEDIEMMRTALNEEGWKDEKLLPNKWKYRRVSKKELHFITEECILFKTFKLAREFVTTKFNSKVVEKLDMFNELESIRRRATSYAWNKDDETIPEGWMSRDVDGKFRTSFFLSPDGIQFPCRRAALQDIIKNEADPEEISLMRNMLKHEGFETSEYLPGNWVYKEVSSNSYQILAEDGSLFESFLATNEYMKSNGNFSAEDFEKINKFEKEKSQERKCTLANWQEDRNLPKGWKSRLGESINGKRFFLSPDGQQFANRRACLQHMLKEGNFKSSDLIKMKQYLRFEGWEENHNLPNGWMFRNTKSKSRGFLLSKEGELFDSVIAAKEYILSHDQYDPSDADNIYKLLEETNKLRRLSQVNDEKSTAWIEDKNLPKGWKTILGTKEIMAPNGTILKSRESALQHMAEKNYSPKEMKDMIYSLKFEGWESSQHLPAGWLCKEKSFRNDQGVNSYLVFISNNGKLFESINSAIEFLKSSLEYTNEQINTFEKHVIKKSLRKKTNLEMWCDDDSLPTGWKLRIAEGKTNKVFYLSPDGTQFQSRKACLVHMIKANYSEEDIIAMKKTLTLEDFEESVNLPSGWLYKESSTKNSGGISVSVIFITENGVIYESFSSVFEFMKSCPFYGEKDAQKLKIFMDEKSSIRRQKLEVWEEDDTLPIGWKLRKTGGKAGKILFLSPEGSQFGSRRAALIYMIKENHTDEDVDFMRSTMKLEGFEENENLPNVWLFKENSSRNSGGISVSVLFIAENGEVYESFSSVLEMMDSSPNFDEEDVLKLKILMNEKSSQRRQTMEVWMEDKSLPHGWKLRKAEGKTGKILYLSPEGSQFGSRRGALIYMIKENHADEDVDFMRSTMKLEGFEENENLPNGWLFKENSSRNSGGISVSVVFIAENGEVYESFSSVLEIMDSSPNFDEEDVLKLKILMNEKSSQRRQTMEVWIEDKSLPRGWKLRKAEGKTGKIFYLSPEGDQFPSRRAALIHMIKNECSMEDVSVMRKTLSLEGFEESKYLPTDWIFKENSSKNNSGVSVSVVFITNQGEVFESFSTVLEMMRSNENYTELDINKLRKLMMEKSSKRRRTMETWEDDKNLPEGWRFRVADGVQGRIFYLSPDGTQLLSRKLAFQHLAKNKDEAGILKMMNLLIKFEKWQENEHLPSGWLYKENSNNALDKGKARVLFSYQFLTSEGEFIEGTNKVIDHLNNSSFYNDSDVEMFNKLVPERQAQRRVKVGRWSEDSTVPDGWKTRIGDGKEARKFFMNQEGKQFQTRRTALQYMIVKKYSDKEINIMREGFESEGWEEDENLPPKWRVKIIFGESKKTLRILTDNGNVLDSFKTARGYISEIHSQYLESFSNFEKNYLRKLKSFPSA